VGAGGQRNKGKKGRFALLPFNIGVKEEGTKKGGGRTGKILCHGTIDTFQTLVAYVRPERKKGEKKY